MTVANKRRFRLRVLADYCKSCRLCVEFCPKKVLEMTTDRLNAKGVTYVVAARPADCIGCQTCVTVCPDAVIELFEEVD